MSVPASEALTNQVDIKYDRQRWAPVTYKKTLVAIVKPREISAAVIVSSSVDSTSETNPTIGEKVNMCWLNSSCFVALAGLFSSLK